MEILRLKLKSDLMVEKSVEFEIVRVKKTETENEFEKALNEFKDVCFIYEKLMGRKFEEQAKRDIGNIQKELIRDFEIKTEKVKSLIKGFYKPSEKSD